MERRGPNADNWDVFGALSFRLWRKTRLLSYHWQNYLFQFELPTFVRDISRKIALCSLKCRVHSTQTHDWGRGACGMSTFVVRALWGDAGGADTKVRTHYLYIRRCSIYKVSFRRSNGRRAACRCGVGTRRREGTADGGGLRSPSRNESVPLTPLANESRSGRADQRAARRIPSSESVIRCCL